MLVSGGAYERGRARPPAGATARAAAPPSGRRATAGNRGAHPPSACGCEWTRRALASGGAAMASAGLLSPSRGLGVRNVDGACVRVSTPVRRLLSPARTPAPAAARAGAERLAARDLTRNFVSTDLPRRARLRVLAAASKRSRIGELRPRIGVAGGVNAKRARKRSAVAGLARSPAAVVSHVLADVSPVLAVNSTSKLYTPAELLSPPSSPISTSSGAPRHRSILRAHW